MIWLSSFSLFNTKFKWSHEGKTRKSNWIWVRSNFGFYLKEIVSIALNFLKATILDKIVEKIMVLGLLQSQLWQTRCRLCLEMPPAPPINVARQNKACETSAYPISWVNIGGRGRGWLVECDIEGVVGKLTPVFKYSQPFLSEIVAIFERKKQIIATVFRCILAK